MAIEQPPPIRPRDRPHPVIFDVEYPERLSRGLIFVKWLLAFPHYFVLWLLGLVASILAFFAWFAILFTGRYPKGIFEIAVGYLRWSANVGAYTGLLRDEYPPFSIDGGTYPLVLDVPLAERQSRWRLFIRWFAIIPNQIVFFFVSIAGFFVTFIAWWAILFTGRYPRGMFRFYTGVMRWQQRSQAYTFLLRDEYPPYSTRADARPGNEVLSAIIGLPILILLGALYAAFWVSFLVGNGETVRTGVPAADDSGAIARERPVAEGGGLRITLTDYDSAAILPEGGFGFAFEVMAENDRWLPVLYIPWLFSIDYCDDAEFVLDDPETQLAVDDIEGDEFRILFGDDAATSTIYFEGPPTFCALEYFLLGDPIRFEFD